MLHPEGVGLNGAQAGCALQHVGQVAKEIFEGLGGVVGHVGEGPEGGYIDEIAVVEAPDVHRAGDACGGGPGDGLHTTGEAEIFGKIVGGARRDIAHLRPAGEGHQAGRHLVEGAVAAGTDDALKFPGPRQGGGGGVPRTLGGVDGYVPARLGQRLQDCGQLAL